MKHASLVLRNARASVHVCMVTERVRNREEMFVIVAVTCRVYTSLMCGK